MNQDTQEDIQAVENKLMDVLWSLRTILPVSDTKDIHSLVNKDELGTAVEMLICVLCEDEIPVPSEDLQKLQWITKILRLTDSIGMVKNIRVKYS